LPAKETRDESPSFGEKNLPQLQGHTAEWRGSRDLQGPASQAAPRLKIAGNAR
jgi:hypothetical protein